MEEDTAVKLMVKCGVVEFAESELKPLRKSSVLSLISLRNFC